MGGLRVLRFVFAALLLPLAGCATASVVEDDGGDTTPVEGGSKDGGSKEAGSCPTGKAGPNCAQCAKGFHACGASSCQPDQPNSPDAGCTNGCTGACGTPMNASATCTPSGSCDFNCNTTYVKDPDGGTCTCDVGLIDCMTGTCQQCCSGADCAAHVTCNSGTCGGCDPGWADCNGNPADGCEADLSQNGNCGSCGTSCCSSICGCGFLGLGGKSCKASGSSYSCQC